MDEITVADLLAWEPRLRLVREGPSRGMDRPVTWAVAARALPPALPTLHGGEVILLPSTVLTEQHVAVETLLPELAHQRVAAVVVDQATLPPALVRDSAPIPLLCWLGSPVSVEVESELNRLLTERRGEIYRLGTELGRLLSNLTATGAGLKQVLEVTREEVALPVFVTDRTGIVLAGAEMSANGRDPIRFDPATGGANLVEQPLRGGGRVWLGPVEPARRAVARLTADRVAVAVEAALDGANWFRSRGPERAETLTGFILSAARREPSDARVQAVALGLDPAATFRVALSPEAAALQSLNRWYAPYGTLFELSDIGGLRAVLIEVRPGRMSGEPLDPRRGPAASASGQTVTDDSWIAQSSAVTGIAELTEAARQASYVAGLLGSGLIRRPAVRFDSATELGGFKLLYRFWGSDELAVFAAEILGDLVSHDRNGVLRQTLLHFLESGGSRVDAAERAAIHRNTLAYRLRRIAELTKLDPNQPGDRLSLHLAVLAQSIPVTT